MEVPGRSGNSFLADESIEFVRAPLDYVDKRRKNHGEVFLGRVLNRPTIFLTSNKAVQDLLTVKWSNFNMGYNEYGLPRLFDENLLFTAGDTWDEARRTLEHVFRHDSVAHSIEQIKHIIHNYFSHLKTGEPIVVYEAFKTLATQLSIALFLSHDIGEEDARDISQLMSTHWRGIISVPLSMRVPWTLWKSGFSKALTAKERLIKIIAERLQSNPSNIASGIHERCGEEDSAVGHLLLFISALIPKALGSLLTSVVIELSKPENARWRQCYNDDALLEDMTLEIQRLWSPFFGGRRICTHDCEVGGYHIPEGHSVAYISHFANRDKDVFPNPDSFSPERWSNENAGDREKVWTFGGGPRLCIGKHLSTVLLKECVKELLRCCKWELVPGQDLTYKTLPIARPKCDIKAVFTRLTSEVQ